MKRLVVVLSLLFLLLIAGCGGQLGGNNGGGSSGSATAVEAIDNFVALEGHGLTPILAASGQGGLVIPWWFLWFDPYGYSPQRDCANVTVSGSLADADADGVPAGATFNGQCSWSVSGNGETATFTLTFSNFRIEDPDDHDPMAGYKASGDISFSAQHASDTVTVQWSVTKNDLTKNSSSSFGYDYEGTWSWNDGSDNYSVPYLLTGTWTPSVTSGDDIWWYGDLVIDAGSYYKWIENNVPKGELDLRTLDPLKFVENTGIESGLLQLVNKDLTHNPAFTCTVTITWQDGSPSFQFGTDCQNQP